MRQHEIKTNFRIYLDTSGRQGSGQNKLFNGAVRGVPWVQIMENEFECLADKSQKGSRWLF